MINRYLDFFKKNNPESPSKHLVIGLGFATDRETVLISHKAIDFYLENKRKPSQEELAQSQFGFAPDPIDIFIRTNEIRSSGGLSPLITGHDTQFYFPVAPGLMSFSEKMIKRVLYDYLYCRNKSHGSFRHGEVTPKQAESIRDFYQKSRNRIFGLGKRVADIWLPEV